MDVKRLLYLHGHLRDGLHVAHHALLQRIGELLVVDLGLHLHDIDAHGKPPLEEVSGNELVSPQLEQTNNSSGWVLPGSETISDIHRVVPSDVLGWRVVRLERSALSSQIGRASCRERV